MKCPACNHHFQTKKVVAVEHNGEPVSLLELSKLTGIAYSTLINRYRRGNRGAELVRSVEAKYAHTR